MPFIIRTPNGTMGSKMGKKRIRIVPLVGENEPIEDEFDETMTVGELIRRACRNLSGRIVIRDDRDTVSPSTKVRDISGDTLRIMPYTEGGQGPYQRYKKEMQRLFETQSHIFFTDNGFDVYFRSCDGKKRKLRVIIPRDYPESMPLVYVQPSSDLHSLHTLGGRVCYIEELDWKQGFHTLAFVVEQSKIVVNRAIREALLQPPNSRALSGSLANSSSLSRQFWESYQRILRLLNEMENASR